MNKMKQTVDLGDRSYDILIENGIAGNAGALIKTVVKSDKCVIITDSNVRPLYAEKFAGSLEKEGIMPYIFTFEAGEKSKNLDVVREIYSFMAEKKINRGNFVVALGGGVTGDMAGFAAATYMRGIQYIQVPTTLLAQVDSSVGGKVAVDIEEGKNLVGSFYHPSLVLIDPMVLKTLTPEIFSDGMAEVIKYGCIADENLFERLAAENIENIGEIIYNCVDIKRRIVERDEHDTGMRMILNFGHTIGHAVEKYGNYEKITHGMGVAIGMAVMAKIGEATGVTENGTAEKIKKCLAGYKLPLGCADLADAVKYIDSDKKNIGKKLNIVLLNKIGRCEIKKVDCREFQNTVLEVLK